jgi:hypothetical protein
MSETPLIFGSLAWWEVFIAGISTFAVFSFLYRENPFYRFFEHLYIGIAAGWGIIVTVRNFLWPQVLKPLFGLDRAIFPDGTASVPYNEGYLLFILPMVFGLLFYFILSKRHSWLAQLVIGFELGFAGGLAFKGTFSEFLPQLFDSFRPLYVQGSVEDSLANIVFVFVLLSSLTYFFFTFKRTPGGAIDRFSSIGRWMMMGCFGAFFGSTIMARMALLVERLDFLIHEWFPLFS